MWEEGDLVEIRVPRKQQDLYGFLHRKRGTVEFVNPNSGFVHVAYGDNGTAVLDPRWLYVVPKRQGKKSK